MKYRFQIDLKCEFDLELCRVKSWIPWSWLLSKSYRGTSFCLQWSEVFSCTLVFIHLQFHLSTLVAYHSSVSQQISLLLFYSKTLNSLQNFYFPRMFFFLLSEKIKPNCLLSKLQKFLLQGSKLMASLHILQDRKLKPSHQTSHTTHFYNTTKPVSLLDWIHTIFVWSSERAFPLFRGHVLYVWIIEISTTIHYIVSFSPIDVYCQYEFFYS